MGGNAMPAHATLGTGASGAVAPANVFVPHTDGPAEDPPGHTCIGFWVPRGQ